MHGVHDSRGDRTFLCERKDDGIDAELQRALVLPLGVAGVAPALHVPIAADHAQQVLVSERAFQIVVAQAPGVGVSPPRAGAPESPDRP